MIDWVYWVFECIYGTLDWNDKMHVLKILGFIKPNPWYWKSLESLEKQILLVRLFKSHVQQGVLNLQSWSILNHQGEGSRNWNSKVRKLQISSLDSFWQLTAVGKFAAWKCVCWRMMIYQIWGSSFALFWGGKKTAERLLVAGRRCKISVFGLTKGSR